MFVGADALRESIIDLIGRTDGTGILIFDCIDGQRLDSDTIRQEHLLALAVCVVLNVVSALVPALYALRHTITESLNSKR